MSKEENTHRRVQKSATVLKIKYQNSFMISIYQHFSYMFTIIVLKYKNIVRETKKINVWHKHTRNGYYYYHLRTNDVSNCNKKSNSKLLKSLSKCT